MSAIPLARPQPQHDPDPINLLINRCLYIGRDPYPQEIHKVILDCRERVCSNIFEATGKIEFYDIDVSKTDHDAMFATVQARLDALRQQASLDHATPPALGSSRSIPRL